MAKLYRLSIPNEREEFAKLLAKHNILLQFDMFDYPYFLVEEYGVTEAKLTSERQKRKRSPNIDETEKSKIHSLRDSGKTVRQISALTGYSIGSVSNILKKN